MRYKVGSVKDGGELAHAYGKLVDVNARNRQSLDFLKQRATELLRSSKQEAAEAWTEVHKVAKERGLLPPGYDSGKSGHYLCVEGEDLYANVGDGADELLATIKKFIT